MSGAKTVMRLFAWTLVSLAIGVLAGAGVASASEDDYIKVLEYKTASLFETSAKLGAIIGGGSEDQIRAMAKDRNIFFFVSGGVDSTVAYTLCLRALGPERRRRLHLDGCTT